tara:strand:+ start:1310 stop:2533 length:1224 start_codon:yes stop_codon:yes gene_type:complete
MRIDSHKITALIIWLNIRKIKIIKHRSKNFKKILVFPKTGGYEDLVQSYDNNKKNDFAFFVLPRLFLIKIFSYYFKKIEKKNYFTRPINNREKYHKNEYIKFLTKTFFLLEKFIKLDGFVSFNIFYRAEKYLEEVFKNLNKKYVILHKESTFTPIEEINSVKVYRKYNTKSLAYKISVYSESQKKILIKSRIAKDSQINVNGCPRSDYAFRLRKIKPKKNIIVYYMIEKFRGSDIILEKTNVNWTKLYNQTLKYLINYAKKNPSVKIIFKGKIGIHKKENFNINILPKNCSFIIGRTGEELLRDANVVIAFNSMTIFETLASNRNLIVPNFNKENKKKKKMLLKLFSQRYFVNTEDQFYRKLSFYLNSKYKFKRLSSSDKKTLKYYLGIIDGKAGEKVQNFLSKILN